MANLIQLKRSSVASKVPTTTQLSLGELALNTYDGKLYTKKDDGTASIVELGGGSKGVAVETQRTISEDYSLTAGYNGLSVGGVEVANGVTVTVPQTSDWQISNGQRRHGVIETTAEELTLPTSAGSSGQVLTTDGSGTLSFATNSAGCDLSATANGTSLTVESSSGTNVALPAASSTAWGVMTDEDKAKLTAIEASATADQTDAEIRAAVEAATDSNVFTDADHTKLDGLASLDLLDEDDFATDSDTKAASQQSIKAYVDNEVAGLVDSAPATLDTLNELAAALGDDANYAATVTTSLGLKAPLASPTFTGTVTVSDAAVGTVATLTDASTVAVDMSTANNFTLTTTSGVGNTRQLGTPSNATAGQSGVIWVHQDGTGSRLLTYAAEWKFAGGTAPTLTTDASAVDCLAYSVLASDKILATAILKVS